MTKVLIILLAALIFEAVGVVLLGRGLKQIGEVRELSRREIVGLARRAVTNPSLLVGIGFEAVFFGALLYLLAQRDVSLVWPLTSLGFVITALAARWVLGEEVSWMRWGGVVLIVLGAGLVSYSEVAKSKPVQEVPSRVAGPPQRG